MRPLDAFLAAVVFGLLFGLFIAAMALPVMLLALLFGVPFA